MERDVHPTYSKGNAPTDGDNIMPDLPSRLRRFIFPLLFAAIQFGFTKTLSAQAPAPTQPSADLEKRVHELEDTVRRLETERSSSVPATATNSTSPQPSTNQDANGTFAQTHDLSQPERPSGDTYFLPGKGSDDRGILAGWDDKRGFFLRSPDDKFTLRLTGQIQADYRAFLDDTDYTDIDSFLVRRARLGIEANVFNYYEFRLLPDFSNRQSPTSSASTVIQDAYLNVHYWDADRKSTRLNSSHQIISYPVFC